MTQQITVCTCYTQYMTETEKAYIAGIIDGEGWIGVIGSGKSNGRTRAKVEVQSCDQDLILWLKEKTGGYIVDRPVKGNRKPAWGWRISGSKALDVLEAVKPYIVMDRRRQKIEQVIEATDHPTLKSRSRAQK